MTPSTSRHRRKWWSGVAIALLTALVLGGYAWLSQRPDDSRTALTLEGNLLHYGDERFVMAGASAYVLPFYTSASGPDASLAETSERGYRQRRQMLSYMRDSGVNTLRIPVALSGYVEDVYDLGGRDAYLKRLRNLVDTAAGVNIVVVVGWWDSHAQGEDWLKNYRDVFPMMRDVRATLEAWPSVVYEPFNEPHGVTWEQWEGVMSDVVRFWREDLRYDGVLLLDTINYSWSFEPEVADRMMQLDAALREGKSSVMFANHRYANYETCFCGDERAAWHEAVGQYLGEYPIIGTEYGRWTGPEFKPQEQWNAEFAKHAADVAIPAGLNGYVAFVWDWVDENSMTDDDGLVLNQYGRLIRDEIFKEYGRPLSRDP